LQRGVKEFSPRFFFVLLNFYITTVSPKGHNMSVMHENTYPMDDLEQVELRARLQHKIDNKTKPLGSLGRLEKLAVQLGLILKTESPRLQHPQMLVCVGDHGIVAHGVSAFPSDVTWQMVANFLAGGAAVSVLARQHGIALNVLDCGVKYDFQDMPGLIKRKVAYGTADSVTQSAMSDAQCQEAINNGREVLKSLPGNAVLIGEMGNRKILRLPHCYCPDWATSISPIVLVLALVSIILLSRVKWKHCDSR